MFDLASQVWLAPRDTIEDVGDRQPFGNRVRFLRTQVLKLSQSDLADRLDVKQSSISRWERGVSSDTYDDFLQALSRLAKIGSVDFSWLCLGDLKAADPDGSAFPNRDAAVEFARLCGYSKAAEHFAAKDAAGDMSVREWFNHIEERHRELLDESD